MIDTVIFGYSDRKLVSFPVFRELLSHQEQRLGLRTRKTGKGLGARKRRQRVARWLRSNPSGLKTIAEWAASLR